MTYRRRTEEDLVHPERILFRLLQDYESGALQNRGTSGFLRAVVEEVDTAGGSLETSPPNPPNSVRARVYTAGMDFNIPNSALTIFYPLGNLRPVVAGEHVIVTFEDGAQTSGYWLGILNRGFDINYTNPGEPPRAESNISHTVEGDSPEQRQANPILQYGGSIGGQSTSQVRLVQSVESTVNHWANKKVLIIGDSQVAPTAPFGNALENYLRDQGCDVTRDGRQGWGVQSWLNHYLHSGELHRQGLDDLISQVSPDIVFISLGGNDGSSGFARRSDYESKVSELWAMAANVPGFRLWSGPPTSVGRAADHQPGRDIANNKIRSVVGANHFVDIRAITTSTEGRTSDGVHFLRGAPAIQPWLDMVIQAGNLL